MRYGFRSAAMALLLASLTACDMVDRVRGRTQEPAAAGGGVTLSLESPGTVRPGEEAAIRLSIWNRGDTAVAGLRAELMLPAWLEPLRPPHEGTSVTMVSSGEGTGLTYPIAEPPLQPGESRTVVQPIRVPAEDWAGADVSPSRTVRARLLGADGQPIGGEITTDLVVEGLGGGTLADTGPEAVAIRSDAVGPLRLGMSAPEVRQRFADARDTTWTAEGTTERGMVVPFAGAGGQPVPVLARLADGQVDRIAVRGQGVRTGEGLGVGSRLEELNAAYGQPCVTAGERGEVVVWYARQPGVSFVLDMPTPPSPDAVRQDPSRLPSSARVRELFVRRGADGC